MSDAVATARKQLLQELGIVQKSLSNEKTRRRASLVQRLHMIRQMLDTGYHYKSQAGQDFVVDQVLGQKEGGTFLDIGAYDGVTGSNSFFFEVFRGWTGLLVEPVPVQAAKARTCRRVDLIEAAIATEEGTSEFLEISSGYTQMSGLVSTYDPGLLKTVRDDTRHAEATITVQTRTMTSLIEQLGKCPDYISLDIEGGEESVLAAFPFHKHPVPVWSIENNRSDNSIRTIMEQAGYRLVEFCGPDEIYQLIQN